MRLSTDISHRVPAGPAEQLLLLALTVLAPWDMSGRGAWGAQGSEQVTLIELIANTCRPRVPRRRHAVDVVLAGPRSLSSCVAQLRSHPL